MTGKELYEKALDITPWATQTLSKKPFPGTEDVMPLICKRAKGSRFWDYDGNEFIDFFCSCGPIILGHHYEFIDDKVKEEIDQGFLFSVASYREYELADKLVGLFPYVGWAKFLKTGADAVSAAVRIARAYTGKDKILQCGYHGWHDWYQCRSVGCGREYGIPEEISKYTIPFKYNDIEFIEGTLKSDSNIAGIVLVPYNWIDEPQNTFLQSVRRLCDRYGVVLIFDEIKTGFRLDLRGAQGYFGVEPDISCFAKAISNGYPLSVVCGKKCFKPLFEKSVFITTTYAGETLSLVAAINTIDELVNSKAFDHIFGIGNRLVEGMKRIGRELNIEIDIKGKAPISTIIFKTGEQQRDNEWAIKFSRINFEKGLFVKIVGGPSYTLCYSHSEEDIDKALDVAEFAIKKIKGVKFKCCREE